MEELLASPATKADALLKVMVWGEPGAGKSRLALSFPSPIVADLERSTRLYADEFSFYVAEPSPKLGASRLVPALVRQMEAGLYPDRETLVIDPITDYLDALELELIKEYEEASKASFNGLKGMALTKAYAALGRGMRARLDRILALPVHVVFVARAKNNWEEVSGAMKVKGRKAAIKADLDYLCDLVINLRKEGRGSVADVQKSRLGELPDVIPAMAYADIQAALAAGLDEVAALSADAERDSAFHDEALRASTTQP